MVGGESMRRIFGGDRWKRMRKGAKGGRMQGFQLWKQQRYKEEFPSNMIKSCFKSCFKS